MNARNILVPIDVAACPLELFSFVNEAAKEGTAAVTLLHVSRLNVAAPENRLYVDVEQEIQSLLARLKTEFFSPWIDSAVCVRSGKPAHEIVAQATASESDLIVLTNLSNHRRKRFFGGDIVEQVIAVAPCPVRVLRVNSRFDLTTALRMREKELPGASLWPAFQPQKFQPELTPSCAGFQGC